MYIDKVLASDVSILPKISLEIIYHFIINKLIYGNYTKCSIFILNHKFLEIIKIYFILWKYDDINWNGKDKKVEVMANA